MMVARVSAPQAAIAVLSFAACLGAVAQSEPPAPTPAKAGQEQQAEPRQSNGQTTGAQQAAKRAPLPVTVDGPITIQKGQEDRDADTRESEQKASNERWLILWTGALVGVTLLLAIITGVLARYTYKLWSDARRTSDRQAVEMRESLDVARDSANAAVVSAMPILVPFVIDQASNLYPEKLIDTSYQPQLSFVFQNLGATVGIVRAARAKLELVTNDRIPEDIDFDELPTTHCEVIVPGKLYGNHARIPGSAVECMQISSINPEEHRLLLHEAKVRPFQRFYLFVQVTYDDFFDTRHTANYCLKVRRGGYHGLHGSRFGYNRITREPIPDKQREDATRSRSPAKA